MGQAWCALPAWAQRSPAKDPQALAVDIMLDDTEPLRHLPLYLAQSLGFFAQEKLAVRWIRAPRDAQSLEQQTVLRAEVFAGSFERVLYTHVHSQANQAFLMLTRTPSVVLGTHGPSTAPTSGMGGMAELAGLRWGVGPAGGLSHRVALLSLQRAGVRASEVQWHHMPTESQLIRAFNAQSIDVVALTDLPAAQVERTGQLRVLLDTRTLRDTDWLYGGPSAGLCLSAHNTYIERNPVVIQSVTQAVLKAMVWMRTATPTDLTRHVPRPLLEPNSAVFFGAWLRSREAFSSDGVFPEGVAMNVLKSLQRLQLVSDVSLVNPAQTFNNRFVIRSRQQLRV